MKQDYCEFFLEHTKNGEGDDNYIFKFGGKLKCVNPNCPYDNAFGTPTQLDADGPFFRGCNSSGLKEKVDN